ncbi:type IV pilus assembly protein PilA [Ruminococcaceae bacterium KH2T8]|nr:type IV pilus assembly protein PilA [Ruminococcaceae bacterium KH2T8]
MKMMNKSKKGFTLVELIVVLVILAVLAAMLVPALTGYIKRARQEKDYQMAATVLTAAQSAATYQFSKSSPAYPVNASTSCGNGETVRTLVGTSFDSCNFSVNSSTGVITGGSVKIGNYTYTWSASTGEWTAS